MSLLTNLSIWRYKVGCDIHVFVEKTNPTTGEWESFEMDERLLPDERHYDLFGFLSDVRSFVTDDPVMNPGWPCDTVQEDSMDYHSRGYEYLNVLTKIRWKTKDYDFTRTYFYVFIKHILPRLCEVDLRDVRILVAYDC